MTFLTIFSAPKPFTNPHINTIQRNAIQSWLHLGKEVCVLLIGEEEGLAEVARDFGIPHISKVTRNQWGTPLVSSIFELAREASNSPILAYTNADILLLPDFVEAARRTIIQARDFLIVGKRWDLDVREPLRFSSNWAQEIREKVKFEGKVHPPAGSDYFIFPRHLFTSIPKFAIGRAGWDNWMIYHARKRGWVTIDATHDITVVHQNHDYNHLPKGKPHYDQDESKHNIKLARGSKNDYTGYMVLDTDKELRNGIIRSPHPNLVRTIRRLELSLMPPEKRGPRWGLVRRLRRARRKITGAR